MKTELPKLSCNCFSLFIFIQISRLPECACRLSNIAYLYFIFTLNRCGSMFRLLKDLNSLVLFSPSKSSASSAAMVLKKHHDEIFKTIKLSSRNLCGHVYSMQNAVKDTRLHCFK